MYTKTMQRVRNRSLNVRKHRGGIMYNILLVDDEKDIVNALKIYLADKDYTFFEAGDGLEAVRIVEKEDIHLVLLDIMMPKLDGIGAMA